MNTNLLARAARGLIWGVMTLFLANIFLMIAAVTTSSIARRWLGTFLPDGYTFQWYLDAWKEFQLGRRKVGPSVVRLDRRRRTVGRIDISCRMDDEVGVFGVDAPNL